jgi:hypothetical protein
VDSARAELAAAGLGLEREMRASTAELFPAALVRPRVSREWSIASVITGEVAVAALVPPRFGSDILAPPFRRSAPANRTVHASELTSGAPTAHARSTWAPCSCRRIAQGTPPAEDRRVGTINSPRGGERSGHRRPSAPGDCGGDYGTMPACRSIAATSVPGFPGSTRCLPACVPIPTEGSSA